MRVMTRGRSWLVVLALVVTAACGGDSPAAPSATDLTGRWSGTSTYPNSPFELQLTQSGSTLRGDYADQHDRSTSASGALENGTIALVVDFGDAKLHFEAAVAGPRRVEGVMFTSALGNRRYPFTMTR